jgi:hypothetical protein
MDLRMGVLMVLKGAHLLSEEFHQKYNANPTEQEKESWKKEFTCFQQAAEMLVGLRSEGVNGRRCVPSRGI